jgi:hypothetical protein
VSDFTRFPTFEKILHYQFPGMMSASWMSRKPGGEASVKLYNDYKQFLQKGTAIFQLSHAALGCPASLVSPPAPQYPGSHGAASLTEEIIALAILAAITVTGAALRFRKRLD